MVKPVRKAVFPVAGQGTRFLPATKAMPKEMLPIVDRPLIQYAVDEAREAGIEEFIFVTGRAKSAIEDHFDHSAELERSLEESGKQDALAAISEWVPEPGQISYTRQQKPLGLGHAVWCARYHIHDEPFAVLLADDLILARPGCLKQMLEIYDDVGGNVVAVEDVPKEHTDRYGILDVVEDDGRLARAKGLVEKPDPDAAPSTLSIIGRYILQPEVFQQLDRQEKGAGGEIQLTDAMARTIGDVPFHGFRFDGKRYDCGNKLGFIGNGGSAGIASHMAIDYSKNGNIRSQAFNDPSALTCLGNDLGYENVFAKQIEFHARPGDLLVAISSSGNSQNILNGVAQARETGCKVVTLSGFAEDNRLRDLGDINFYVPSREYGFVEITHLALCHAVVDFAMGWRPDS